jgi:hypothetical protein
LRVVNTLRERKSWIIITIYNNINDERNRLTYPQPETNHAKKEKAPHKGRSERKPEAFSLINESRDFVLSE